MRSELLACDAHFPIHYCKPWSVAFSPRLLAKGTGCLEMAPSGDWLLQHPDAEVSSATPLCASAAERGLEKDQGQSPLATHKESGGRSWDSGSAVVWLSSQMRAWSLGFFLVNGPDTRRKQITSSHFIYFLILIVENITYVPFVLPLTSYYQE